MADQAGTPPGGVSFRESLPLTARDLDFFQVLRRLECAHVDNPGFGRSVRPAEDPVRLGQQPSLIFAPTMLAKYEPATERSPARLLGYFFGMFGPNGPLPHHLTEYALQRKFNEKDPTFAAFVDIFHHRMMSLLYRAWASSRPTVNLDRPARDRFAIYAGALFGLGQPALRDLDDLPDHAKLHFAGILAMQSRPAEGLRTLLENFFYLPARVQEMQGAWMRLPRESRLRLGETEDTGMLGSSTVLGASVWGCQQRFRIVLGPLGLADLERMLPGRASIGRLVALVRNFIGDEKDWDLQLVLRREEVPALQLGREGQLGWTSWLSGSARDRDADDVVLAPAPGHA